MFVETLQEEMRKIHKMFNFSKKLIFTEEDEKDSEKATCCWICREEFGKERKVRDHCHLTGKFRSAAHENCNLQFKKLKFTPVVFHNLLGYDSHLFIKNLGKNDGQIKAIPNNEEKYISFSKDIVLGSYRDEKKGKFYSKLNDSEISEEDYEFGERVWKEFGMETIGDYHDLYLKSDVMLLTDLFE